MSVTIILYMCCLRELSCCFSRLVALGLVTVAYI